MHAKYWSVGAQSSTPLPLSLGEISGHLLADWVPSMPTSMASSFVGWPPHLMEAIDVDGNHHWALHGRVKGTERQWKGVLSWMLGVVGARQVLQDEGYRWIAPLSAFYPGKSSVDLTRWNPDFPPSRLVAEKPAKSTVRLRPDYIAIREVAGTDELEWAVVEAKGTGNSLSGLPGCPSAWREQVRNIDVEFDGTPLAIARHLVVATRSNPNAQRRGARCVQVRAWNSQDAAVVRPPKTAAAEVAAAHLFGLCRNLGLRENAQAIALAVEVRASTRNSGARNRRLDALREIADRSGAEFERVLKRDATAPPGTRSRIEIPSEFGLFQVEIDDALLRLVRALGSAETSETAAAVLSETDRALDVNMGPSRRRDGASTELNDGVKVRIPEAAIRMVLEPERQR